MKIDFKIQVMQPSKNITPQIVIDHFNWRKFNIYNGTSTIQIGDVKEPIWWNRPLKSDNAVKLENDGIYSYNLPYIYNNLLYKSGYNLLVGEGSVPLMALIKMNVNWSPKQRRILDSFIRTAVYDTLIELGVDKTKLGLPSNDMLYDGKKFMGFEAKEHYGWYGAAAVITLNYSNEADIFKRLTGEFAFRRPICGIQEEADNKFTKEQFMELLLKNLKKYTDQL